MIRYKDRTFCSAKCLRTTCPRNFTDEVQQAAREWWSHDPDNAPVAFLDFSPKCPDYQPVKGI